ncbi:MAG: hypothetical protein GC200_09545 [Tepidisphaera sp.]|nr:hypothetical protein [Tepidisphaera sp.]
MHPLFRRTHAVAAAGLLSLLAGLAFAQPAAPAGDAKPAAPALTDPDPKLHAKDAPKQYNVDKKSLAIEGYDPVAYFPEGGSKPQEGDKNITFTHNGITYRFASKEHLELFKANPDKYEPAHGGWCSYAMGATGEKVEVDPESYVVDKGRLFLFYKDFFNDTRKKFLADKAKLLSAADANWKKTSGEDARTPETIASSKDAPAKKDSDKPADPGHK